MYAGVVTVHVLPDRMDEAIRIYRDSVVPAAQRQTGYRGHYLLTDRDTGTCISIGLWETEADMTATKTSGAYLQRVAMLKDVLAAPPVREDYEVSIQV